MENEQRRRTAVVVALVVVVAMLVVGAMQCASSREAGDSGATRVASEDMTPAGGPSRRGETAESAGRGQGDNRSTRASGSATAAAKQRPTRPRAEPETDTTAVTDAAVAKPAKAGSVRLEGVTTSPLGRFAVVGGSHVSVSGLFGASVAIDGDIAVVAAPGQMSRGWVVCGAAYVFERREHVWTPTAELDSPRSDVAGFARRVAVSGTRIAVFGGVARSSDAPVFNTYVRAKDGSWSEEAEVPTGEPMCWDATLRGAAAFVGEKSAVGIYRLDAGSWSRVQSLTAPPDRARARFGVWLSPAGETLAVDCDDVTGPDGIATESYLYRLRDGAFVEETRLSFETQRLFGCLARAGAALVSMGGSGPLIVSERDGATWGRALTATKEWGAMRCLETGHPFAADGNLVVGASGDWHEFVVLERREDGWYRTAIAPPADLVPRDTGMWPPANPYVALSGRTAVVGTGWQEQGDGRFWFFDITDDDLARATKVESDAK